MLAGLARSERQPERWHLDGPFTVGRGADSTAPSWRATLKRTGQADLVTTYAYNKVNQLCWAYSGTSGAGCGSPPSGATTYSFDANGNQLTGGFAYDS